LHLPSQSRKCSTSPNISSRISAHITPALFKDIRTFWFEHIDSDESLIFPSRQHAIRWFMGGEVMDKQCV
jgi:hypothetical protein